MDPSEAKDASHGSLTLAKPKIWGKALEHPVSLKKSDELGTKKWF